jgi:hypothetical protein
MIRNRPLLTVGAIALLLACLWSPAAVAVNPAEGQICDATADYFLAAENYPEAIRLHREVLRKYSAERARSLSPWFCRGDGRRQDARAG